MNLNNIKINNKTKQDVLGLILEISEGDFSIHDIENAQEDIKIVEKGNDPIYKIALYSNNHPREITKISLEPLIYSDGGTEENDEDDIAIYLNDGVAFANSVAYGEYVDDDNDASAHLTIFFCNDTEKLKKFIENEVNTLKNVKFNALKNKLNQVLHLGYEINPNFLSEFLKTGQTNVLKELLKNDLEKIVTNIQTPFSEGPVKNKKSKI